MNKPLLLTGVDWVAVLILGGVFLYTGTLKILDAGQLYHDIQSYRLLPDTGAWWLAHYLPWLEVTLGLSLFLPRMRTSAALILGGLVLVFMAGLLSAWFRGLDISCGCFGASSDINRYGWWLLRDAGLLMLAGFLFLRGRVVDVFSLFGRSSESAAPGLPEME